MEHLARAYHKCDHDGQSVGYLLGSFYQDDSQTDGHPHHTSQEGCRADQGVGARVDLRHYFAEERYVVLSRRQDELLV